MVQVGLNLISQAITIYDCELKQIHTNHRMQTMFQLSDELMLLSTYFGGLLRYVAGRGEYGQLDDFIDIPFKNLIRIVLA